MNFFEHQDRARTKTLYLVFLFVLAVACVIAAVYILILFSFYSKEQPLALTIESLWRPEIFYKVAVGLCGVIGLASLIKILVLANGGGAGIAEYMGGRKVDPGTSDPEEKQLLNIVEEVAIASGTPVPSVYVLDDENTINAFAAGLTPGDSVIAVTKGTLGFLDRDELQGVVAHEFSHIVNGDVKLNIRLMGLLNGILFIALVGRGILRSTGRSSRGRKGGGGQIAILGLGFLVIGYIGVFFANLIKSAVSRQREFLADASAVQFTRNPGGIAGALKKIGGCHQGRSLFTHNADEASHMLFDSVAALNLFSTHPPLTRRIQAIEPQFNGQYVEPTPIDYTLSKEHAKALRDIYPEKAAAAKKKPSQMVGQLSPVSLALSAQMIQNINEDTVLLTRDAVQAQALVFAFLIYEAAAESYPSPCSDYLQKNVEPFIYDETVKTIAKVAQVNKTERLTLIKMSFPALKNMSLKQYEKFKSVLYGLILSDKKTHLFEFCISRMLSHYLDQHFFPQKTAHPTFSLKSVWRDIEIVVSTVSYYGTTDEALAQLSFDRAMVPLGRSTIRPRSDCSLENFENSISNLKKSSPKIKQQVIDALGISVRADDQITIDEYELLRTVSSLLDCPMPPIVLQ